MLKWIIALCCVCSLWLGGCPTPPGPGDAGEQTPESGGDKQCSPPSAVAPQITGLTYEGTAKHQPYILRFAVSWTDPDRDLKGGSFQFVVDGTPLKRQALPSDDDSLNEASGTIELPMILDQSMVQGKDSLTAKLTLWDRDGNDANQPTFQVEIKP